MKKLITIGLVCIVLASGAFSSTYYASPGGTGNGRSETTPFRISNFWSVAEPGDSLILLNGAYRGSSSMIAPPTGLDGTSQRPVVITAKNDGEVEIDGENNHVPIDLNGNDYFVIEGINAHSADSRAVVHIHGGSSYNIIRRVCAWDAQNANTDIFGCHGAEHNLFEDCAGWGVARKIYSNSQGGNYTTYRRCWGKWEYCTVTGPKMVYSLFYNSYHILIENCIGTWDSELSSVDQPFGIFALDRQDGSSNCYCRELGCIAYVKQDQNFHPNRLFLVTKVHDIEVKDCVAYIDDGARSRQFSELNTYVLYGSDRLVAENLTSIGGDRADISSGWNTSNVYDNNDADNLVVNNGNILNPSLNGISSGATVMKRYVNGELTNEDLWPWPMNQRIIDAMILSGRDPVDVTRTVFELGGGVVPQFGGFSINANASISRGVVPLNVNFSVNVSGGNQPYLFHWDFGDNSSSEQQRPTHYYLQVGTYRVNLTVKDASDEVRTREFTINALDPDDVLSVTDIKFCPFGEEQELAQIRSNVWYDMYIYFKTPAGWSEISYADFWMNNSNDNRGSVENRGSVFNSSSNYPISISISTESIWPRQSEGSAEGTNITGTMGLYIDDSSGDYVINPEEGSTKVKIKLLPQANSGEWFLNCYIRSTSGVNTDCYKESIEVISVWDTDAPSIPKNINAEYTGGN